MVAYGSLTRLFGWTFGSDQLCHWRGRLGPRAGADGGSEPGAGIAAAFAGTEGVTAVLEGELPVLGLIDVYRLPSGKLSVDGPPPAPERKKPGAKPKTTCTPE